MKVRCVSNYGSPLRSPKGHALKDVRVTFKLVGADLAPTDVWDAISGERILPLLVYTETDSHGEFSVLLWPNDRGEKPTYYECYVSIPGAASFIAYLTDGPEIPCTDWLSLRITDLMSPLAASLLQMHMQNIAVHLTPADRARLDALALMQAPFYYTVDTGTPNNLVLPYTQPLPQHTTGLPLLFRAKYTNTGPCTVNIDALSAAIVLGADNQELVAGQILVDKIYQLVYDGSFYQLLNPYITNVVGDSIIIDTFDASSEAEMLALVAQKGDSCRRLDLSKTFILKGNDAQNPLNWVEILAVNDTNYGGF
jgi:hypothetical protein